MVIHTVALSNLRNHDHSELVCARDVTILTGRNGAGKTSVLEAISMSALGRSFVPVPESALVRHGAEMCSVTVVAERDRDVPYKVSIAYREGVRKRIETSIGSNLTARDLIGELPIVALSPDHKSITFGAPSDRRAFVDAVMAQASKRVTDLLYEHRRLLKQRNALLAQCGGTMPPSSMMAAWTEALAICSAELVRRRRDFLKDFGPRVHRSYAEVSGAAEEIELRYEPDGIADVDNLTDDEIVSAMLAAAERNAQQEVRRGLTLFGPQRDDLTFLINGGLVKETASQGQHKSLLVALKLAECTILRDLRDERPVVLLDDVFSELDRDRCARVMKLVLAMGMQCFVTTTDGDEIAALVPPGTDVRLVTVDGGAFKEAA